MGACMCCVRAFKMPPVLHISLLLKRMCLSWALLLIALLAMGPFLHAHFGASRVTGLHVAGVASSVTHMPAVAGLASLSQDDEPESAALGVETSYARQLVLDVQDEPQTGWVFTLFVLAVWVSCQALIGRQPYLRRQARPSLWAGMPPPAHAPPALIR